MASHFELIGLDVKVMEDMEDYYDKGIKNGTKIKTKLGDYYLWEMGNGAELWLQYNKDESVGMNPHFSGISSFDAIVKQTILRPGYPALDASLECTSVDGEYPFVVDLPNFFIYKNIKDGEKLKLQIAAFPHSLNLYKSEEELNKESGEELKLALKHFIPTGLFQDENAEDKGVRAEAMFGGEITKVERIENQVTGNYFYYVKTNTYGGDIDVLISPSLLEENIEPQVGNIISGQFWLSAKILDRDEKSDFFGKFKKMIKG